MKLFSITERDSMVTMAPSTVCKNGEFEDRETAAIQCKFEAKVIEESFRISSSNESNLGNQAGKSSKL